MHALWGLNHVVCECDVLGKLLDSKEIDEPLDSDAVREALCANIVETPSYPLISEQGGKDDNLCW